MTPRYWEVLCPKVSMDFLGTGSLIKALATVIGRFRESAAIWGGDGDGGEVNEAMSF